MNAPSKDKRGLEDPLGVSGLLPGDDQVYAHLATPPGFETPLRDLDERGRPIKNWCGFYALWLVCHYLWPHKWNLERRPPSSARAEEILGLDVPERVAWTALRIGRAPSYFAQHGARLHVNGVPISGYLDFLWEIVRGWIRRPVSALAAEDRVIDLIRSGQPVVLDLPLPRRLLEHAVFVYGVCHEGFIVIDSLTVPEFGYRKVTLDDDPRLIMLLPFAEFQRRWGRGSGIWHVVTDGAHTQRIA